ncbi:hypothetical protein HJFPF1_10555 [Paramyrothecium foliicola]|nr:hypothetical protein HJFPF1_10555 [Paramyrothecium foliicola]
MYFNKLFVAVASFIVASVSGVVAAQGQDLQPRGPCVVKDWQCASVNQRRKEVGHGNGDYSVWIHACWLSEYRVIARLMISNGGNSEVGGEWFLTGKGVQEEFTDKFYASPGVDERSGKHERNEPFGSSKRILSIKGAVWRKGNFGDKIGTTMCNPWIYTKAECDAMEGKY